MPMVTVRDKLKSKLGYSGLRIGWEKDKARVRELCPGINLRLFNQNLGPSIDVLSSLISAAVRRTERGTQTADQNGLPAILRQKQAILNIVASYRAICIAQINNQINNPSNSAELQQGWSHMQDGVARVEGRINTINGPY